MVRIWMRKKINTHNIVLPNQNYITIEEYVWNTCVRFVHFNWSWNSTIIIANRFFLLSFFIHFNSICIVFFEKLIWVKCSDRLQVNFKLCVSHLLNVLTTINCSNCVHVLIAFKRIQSNWSAVCCSVVYFLTNKIMLNAAC